MPRRMSASDREFLEKPWVCLVCRAKFVMNEALLSNDGIFCPQCYLASVQPIEDEALFTSEPWPRGVYRVLH